MARLEDLSDLRESLLARMSVCESDQNYAVMGRLLADVLKQIDELGTATEGGKATGLSDFEKRLAERESGAKGSRKAAGS